MPEAIAPFSYLTIAKVFLLALGFLPDVNAEAILQGICPLAEVLLAAVLPDEITIPVYFVISEIALVVIACAPSDLAAPLPVI